MAAMSFFPGGAFRIAVVSATAAGLLPAGVRAGTLGVITTLEVKSVYALNSAPGNPVTGDIWAFMGSSSLAPIQINDKITLYPRAVYQWTGAAWTLRAAYVYIAAAWVELTMNLYDNGVFFLATTFEKSLGDTLTFQSTRIYLTDHGGRGEAAVIRGYFSNALDLANINSVKILLDWITATESDRSLKLFVGPNKTGTKTAYTEITAEGSELLISVDVSALSGQYYIGIEAWAGPMNEEAYPDCTVYIAKCYLEK